MQAKKKLAARIYQQNYSIGDWQWHWSNFIPTSVKYRRNYSAGDVTVEVVYVVNFFKLFGIYQHIVFVGISIHNN